MACHASAPVAVSKASACWPSVALSYRTHPSLVRISVSSLRQPYSHAIESRTSNPASSTAHASRCQVRVPPNARRCPPGLRTRRASCAHRPHHAPNARLPDRLRSYRPASAAADLYPPFSPALGDGSPGYERRFAMVSEMKVASHALPMNPMPYGGSVTTASTLDSGMDRITSMQSPWCSVTPWP